MQASNLEIKEPSCVVIDLDGTIVQQISNSKVMQVDTWLNFNSSDRYKEFEYRYVNCGIKRIIESKVEEELKKDGAVKIKFMEERQGLKRVYKLSPHKTATHHGNQFDFLLFGRDRITKMCRLAIKKKIPIIVLTHSRYNLSIVWEILNQEPEKKAVNETNNEESVDEIKETENIEHKKYKKVFKEIKYVPHLFLSKKPAEKICIVKQILFSLNDENSSEEGEIYFFNRHDINTEIFKEKQNELNQLKKAMNLQFPEKKQLTWTDKNNIGEVRKYLSALVAVNLVNEIRMGKGKKFKKINLEKPEDREKVIFIDDQDVLIAGAKRCNMTTIQAKIIKKDEENNKEYFDPKKREAHIWKACYYLEHGIQEEVVSDIGLNEQRLFSTSKLPTSTPLQPQEVAKIIPC
jgi:predicted HAD superfamily phosphohydrolase YqeG